MSIKAKDLINWSLISLLFTGRNDVIRVDRVQKKHKESIKELLTFIDYWLNKYDKN